MTPCKVEMVIYFTQHNLLQWVPVRFRPLKLAFISLIASFRVLIKSLYFITWLSFNFYLVSLIICLTLDSDLPEESLAMSYNIESELQYTLNVVLGKSLVTRIRRLHFNKVR